MANSQTKYYFSLYFQLSIRPRNHSEVLCSKDQNDILIRKKGFRDLLRLKCFEECSNDILDWKAQLGPSFW